MNKKRWCLLLLWRIYGQRWSMFCYGLVVASIANDVPQWGWAVQIPVLLYFFSLMALLWAGVELVRMAQRLKVNGKRHQ